MMLSGAKTWPKNRLGFALPASIEISIGQLGQPELIRSEEAKAA
jgi:hypothetical protein